MPGKFLQLQLIVCDEKPFQITCLLLLHVISWGKPGKSSIRIGWCMGHACQWQKDMTRQLMREEAVKGSIWRWWQHHHFPPKFGPRQSHGRQQVAKVDCYLVWPNWRLILWSSSSKSSSLSYHHQSYGRQLVGNSWPNLVFASFIGLHFCFTLQGLRFDTWNIMIIIVLYIIMILLLPAGEVLLAHAERHAVFSTGHPAPLLCVLENNHYHHYSGNWLGNH